MKLLTDKQTNKKSITDQGLAGVEVNTVENDFVYWQ